MNAGVLLMRDVYLLFPFSRISNKILVVKKYLFENMHAKVCELLIFKHQQLFYLNQ